MLAALGAAKRGRANESAIGLACEAVPVRGCEHPAYESKVRNSRSEQIKIP